MPGLRSNASASHSVTHSAFAPPLALASTQSGWCFDERENCADMSRWLRSRGLRPGDRPVSLPGRNPAQREPRRFRDSGLGVGFVGSGFGDSDSGLGGSGPGDWELVTGNWRLATGEWSVNPVSLTVRCDQPLGPGCRMGLESVSPLRSHRFRRFGGGVLCPSSVDVSLFLHGCTIGLHTLRQPVQPTTGPTNPRGDTFRVNSSGAMILASQSVCQSASGSIHG